ncbi:MAG: nicotinic acid mononucleotide adenyltransferase [Bacteroidota bacterium]
MKKLLIILVMLCVSFTYAQNNTNVKYEKEGDFTMAKYYYEDGTVQQKGAFNAQGQLHGTWTSFDVKGNKMSVGNYIDGQKEGKWFFWTKTSLREVDYLNSKIVSVNEWKDKSKLAIRD